MFRHEHIPQITATRIGTWADGQAAPSLAVRGRRTKSSGYFGSVVRHHQIDRPWLAERSRAGIPPCAARPIRARLGRRFGELIKTELEDAKAR